jgi:hypothetical protein
VGAGTRAPAHVVSDVAAERAARRRLAIEELAELSEGERRRVLRERRQHARATS